MENYISLMIVAYLVLMSVLGYISMYSDKKRAIQHKYRIPEKTLFIIALMGGSIGSILGMQQFRHKTKHWYFKYGMPSILFLQCIIILYMWYMQK